MPLYDQDAIVKGLMRMVPHQVLNETMSDGEKSEAVAIAPRSGQAINITMDIRFTGGTPTSVEFQLQVAISNNDSRFRDLGPPMTDTDGGKITVTDVNAKFARILAVDADTENIVATITQV